MLWQILAVVYVGGILAMAVPMTKWLVKHHAGTDYHGKQKKADSEDFWMGFTLVLLLIWFWPLILIGFYVKQLVMEDK